MDELKIPFKKRLFRWVVTRNITNRDEWVLKKLNELAEGSSILDAGAGEQKYRKMCEHLKYTSQDFCQYDGKGDSVGEQVGEWDTSGIDIVGDIWNIDVPDASFDSVLCTEVFEHIMFPSETVKEFARILKPGGTLILTAPFCSLTHFAPYHFYSGFNSYWYKSCLEENGFVIDEIERNGNYYDWMRQELVRMRKIARKYSHRGMGLLYYVFLPCIILRLKYLSKNDNGSGEVLCFGYHVKAHKVG